MDAKEFHGRVHVQRGKNAAIQPGRCFNISYTKHHHNLSVNRRNAD